jgi:hypothetical protein
MIENRFYKQKSSIEDYMIYDDDKEDAYFVSCKDESNVDYLVKLLNNLHEENQIKLEIIDAFIRGLEDEKGIVPEDREFQCRMNHTIKVLKELKRDMLHPNEFKRLRKLEE